MIQPVPHELSQHRLADQIVDVPAASPCRKARNKYRDSSLSPFPCRRAWKSRKLCRPHHRSACSIVRWSRWSALPYCEISISSRSYFGANESGHSPGARTRAYLDDSSFACICLFCLLWASESPSHIVTRICNFCLPNTCVDRHAH